MGRVGGKLAAGAVLLIAALALPLWLSRSPAQELPVATVARGPLQVVVATNATVEPIDDFEVRARLAGRVVEVQSAGSRVEEAGILVQIDATPVAAEIESARSQRLEAEESLRAARTQLERTERSLALDEKLYRDRALSKDRLAEVRAERDEARARLAFLEQEVPVRLAALELRIAELQAQLAGAVVRAPFAGTVYRADVEVGEVVRHGQRILSFGDLERLQLRAHVDQVDLGRVRPGNPIVVAANAFPGRTWRGSLTEVVPHVAMHRNRAVAEATAEIDPPVDGLLPGMNVDVEIVVQEERDILQIPSRAIFASGAGPFAFRVEGGRVVEVPLQLGLSSFTRVEVLAGLTEGDVVVLGPAAGLRAGMRVVPQHVNDAPG